MGLGFAGTLRRGAFLGPVGTPPLGGVLVGDERGPSFHDLAPFLEQVRPRVGGFRLVFDAVGNAGFQDLAGRVGEDLLSRVSAWMGNGGTAR